MENGGPIARAVGNAPAAAGTEQRAVGTVAAGGPFGDRSLLIVEDDALFLERLARALGQRGFAVRVAAGVADARAQLEQALPAFAVVDMRLGDGNGLELVSAITRRRPEARVVVLTGYGNLATAVNATKRGAFDYLCKPVDADDVAAALLAGRGRTAAPQQRSMSANRVRWEHIQQIYRQCGLNVSETARSLRMHRRTLQRVLARGAPR